MPQFQTTKRTPYGSRLVQARKSAGLKQVELAALVGISQSTLAAAENRALGSRHTPTLARVLKVNPIWLQDGTGPRTLDAAHTEHADLFTGSYYLQAKPAPTEIAMDSPRGDGLSPLALELASMFDKVADQTARAQAYTSAIQEILRVLSESDADEPTHTPERSAPRYSEKQHG